MCFLVNRCKLDAQSVLVHHLYQPHLFEGLLQEADDVGAKRQACTELAASLRKCLQIVNRIRDNSSYRKQGDSGGSSSEDPELVGHGNPEDPEQLQAVAELSRRDYTQQPSPPEPYQPYSLRSLQNAATRRVQKKNSDDLLDGFP